ncbi:MAG: hypothetical protein H6514_15670 [Acidimicrobiaceae bacterium]|nr:hypothetical protein [Acidimicrobiaceae bacterium]
MSTLVSDVLPVAGLLAETAMSLTCRTKVLRSARSPACPCGARALVLLSADDFCDIAHTEITVEHPRRDLL